ncbi:MAG: tRNA delta(2)-isopentenylpyrophosphate transferase, tRNA dimethylallyltransferase [Candidatus Parcubacteria bacterium]|jgi:tRNA dimethylallyltransferase
MNTKMQSKPHIVVVCGPTATGKTQYAIELAKKINGEVISADSRQVYTGMNIGSGKVTREEMQGIPHHLIDVVSPKKVFTVSDYQQLATQIIEEIISRGKVPIICGGTGFYIDALVNQSVIPNVPPNKKLRLELNKESAIKLFELLLKLDKRRAQDIDPHNKVRLIRAIEIAKTLGKVPKVSINAAAKYDVEWIGIDRDDAVLKARIEKRLTERFDQGMIEEVQALNASGISWRRLLSFGLEYRYITLFLQNKISKEEMIEKLKTEIWQYAKRQRTWFKRNKNIKWIDPDKAL